MTHTPAKITLYHWLFSLITISALALMSPIAVAQQGASPSINRPYENPDWQRWVNTFERQGREVYDRRFAIIEASDIRPGIDIADIGAGTGLFTRLLAPLVLPGGSIYAVDISQTFVDNILRTSREQGISNVKGVVNNQTDVALPANSIDLAFIVDTYHHFEQPQPTMTSVHKALRDNGRVIIIDFRKDPFRSSPWIMNHVRGNKAEVIAELQAAGFKLLADKPILRTNYFLEFEKVN